MKVPTLTLCCCGVTGILNLVMAQTNNTRRAQSALCDPCRGLFWAQLVLSGQSCLDLPHVHFGGGGGGVLDEHLLQVLLLFLALLLTLLAAAGVAIEEFRSRSRHFHNLVLFLFQFLFKLSSL